MHKQKQALGGSIYSRLQKKAYTLDRRWSSILRSKKDLILNRKNGRSNGSSFAINLR